MDTASTTASVAVYDLKTVRLLGEMTWEGRRRQTQDLMAMVRHLLNMVAVAPDDLTALAVTTGPGSFTGVRIAISAVKGIGLGMATTPTVIGAPTLAVTAAPWQPLAAVCEPTPVLCAVMLAGRGRYHWAVFPVGESLHRPAAADHHTGVAAELAAFLDSFDVRSIWLVGENDAALLAAVQPLARVVVIDPAYGLRRAGVLAGFAAKLLAAGVNDSLATLQPLYLREP